MITRDLHISTAPLRILSPHLPPASAEKAASLPLDSLVLSGVKADAAPPPQARRLYGVALAGMMLPAVFGAALHAGPAHAQAVSQVARLTTVQVGFGDALRVKVQPGESYFSIAQNFSSNELGTFVADIQGANHGVGLHPGSTIIVPVTEHSGPKLKYAVAAQKQFGRQYSGLQWQAARATAGPEGSWQLDVPAGPHAGRNGDEIFYVGPTSTPDQYKVMTRQQAERLHPELFTATDTAATQEIPGGIVEEANTFHVPSGTEKLVFGQNRVATYDATGKLTARERFTDHVVATTLHDRPDVTGHALLTQTADGQLEVHVPPGTVRVQIDPEEMSAAHQSKFDGTIYALDGEAHTLASEESSDVRIVPRGADFLSSASVGQMLTSTRDAARIQVPAGTREIVVNSAETQYDGSLVALDGSGTALQVQPNWNGSVDDPSPGTLIHFEKGRLQIRVLPGTDRVEIARGAVSLLDAQGKVIAAQPNANFVIGDGPLE
jgi:hypothetical protein